MPGERACPDAPRGFRVLRCTMKASSSAPRRCLNREASQERPMPDPLSLSAREAAREIAAGRLRAEALMTACLERIAAREPEVGAWQYLDREAALEAARRCDASAPSGPLHGIPIAVKDLIDTVDMPTGYGSAIYAGHRPGPTPPASRWRAPPGRSSSEKPSRPNSPASRRARPPTRATRRTPPAARRAARPPRWPTGWRRSPSARRPPAR